MDFQIGSQNIGAKVMAYVSTSESLEGQDAAVVQIHPAKFNWQFALFGVAQKTLMGDGLVCKGLDAAIEQL
jgi:hypothetical protein